MDRIDKMLMVLTCTVALSALLLHVVIGVLAIVNAQ